jgi:predicted cupin superfamily sugar epimerase
LPPQDVPTEQTDSVSIRNKHTVAYYNISNHEINQTHQNASRLLLFHMRRREAPC